MKSIERHVIKSGLLITAGLVAYFLLMRVAGLAEVTELRALNALIMFSGVYLAVREFKKSNFGVGFDYLSGIAVGFFTSMVVAISFSIFVGLYVTIDPVFLAAIVADNPQKEFLNPWTASMVIFIEGIASGFLFSYTAMQYLKNDRKAYTA